MGAVNSGFWDLDGEDRGAVYSAAEEATGQSFWDLDAETRGAYYDRAEGYLD